MREHADFTRKNKQLDLSDVLFCRISTVYNKLNEWKVDRIYNANVEKNLFLLYISLCRNKSVHIIEIIKKYINYKQFWIFLT
ncbi:hypothetical protein DBV15_01563 [Temnothorax longispinosus]|uniref:Uncharacterized protein n=1 Tax=Temnothorax longispinosus TaxID=300112 RepID=A0A4S2KTP8_9HYME|nr:hypothetical protein DBV15_01563 [Temnothorax longispinosus]